MKKSVSNLKPLSGALELSEYNLLINKKPRKVKLPDLRKKTAFRIEVNGKAVEVELSENIDYDKPFFIKVDGKPYKVEIGRGEIGGLITVKVDGVPYPAQFENKNRIVPQALKPTLPIIEKKLVKTQVSDKGVIAASMPGKVVLLRVKAEDHVRAGDVLLVLEAMKMENEIATPISGFVKEVKVSEGSAVNIGDIMVVVSET